MQTATGVKKIIRYAGNKRTQGQIASVIDECPDTLGGRVLRARLARGWNQKELVDRSALAWNTVYRLERDQIKEPKSQTFFKVAEALGVSVLELFGEPVSTAQAVKFRRLSAGMRKGDLARRAGVKPSSVAKIEDGDPFLPSTIRGIASALGVPLGDLVIVRGTPGQRIRLRRIALGMRAEEVASRARVGRTILSRIERDMYVGRGPSDHAGIMARITQVLGSE